MVKETRMDIVMRKLAFSMIKSAQSFALVVLNTHARDERCA
jgi:hypothetical protein